MWVQGWQSGTVKSDSLRTKSVLTKAGSSCKHLEYLAQLYTSDTLRRLKTLVDGSCLVLYMQVSLVDLKTWGTATGL